MSARDRVDTKWLMLVPGHWGPRSRCGRPTHRKGPCQTEVAHPFPACAWHTTEQEWEELARLADEMRATHGDLDFDAHDPACWSWVAPTDIDMTTAPLTVLHRWQAGRCAMCGTDQLDLVKDHDHVTGRMRGLLCQSCNLREPGGDANTIYGRYRHRPPTAILRLEFDYVHPLGDSPITELDPDTYDLSRSPSHAVSRALLGDTD